MTVLGAGKLRMLGYADARVPESAPGRPRLCDTPIDELVEATVSHIRAVRPQILITHDAYGQLPGHPDHVRTHQATIRAFHAAGLEHRYPDAGQPWHPQALYAATHPHSRAGTLSSLMKRVGKTTLSVPDEQVTTAVDVGSHLDQKWRAILAHRSQVTRERPLPGILSRLAPVDREPLIRTESFTRLSPDHLPGMLPSLTC